jgi:hypothetical protein
MSLTLQLRNWRPRFDSFSLWSRAGTSGNMFLGVDQETLILRNLRLDLLSRAGVCLHSVFWFLYLLESKEWRDVECQKNNRKQLFWVENHTSGYKTSTLSDVIKSQPVACFSRRLIKRATGFPSHILKLSKAQSYIHYCLSIFNETQINRTWQNAPKYFQFTWAACSSSLVGLFIQSGWRSEFTRSQLLSHFLSKW